MAGITTSPQLRESPDTAKYHGLPASIWGGVPKASGPLTRAAGFLQKQLQLNNIAILQSENNAANGLSKFIRNPQPEFEVKLEEDGAEVFGYTQTRCEDFGEDSVLSQAKTSRILCDMQQDVQEITAVISGSLAGGLPASTTYRAYEREQPVVQSGVPRLRPPYR